MEQLREAGELIGTPTFDAALTKFLPDDLAGMATLFSAIAHGAAAGEHRAAYQEVYFPRVNRGKAYIASELKRSEMGSAPAYYAGAQGLTPVKMRRQAEEHVQAAARLIEETGYHRRDRELAELRARLDAG
jgi:hypothetical protein